MKAVIVAAGMSRRLRPLTNLMPKPLLEIDGDSLIGRSVRLLRDNGVDEIIVVVGYRHEQIMEHLDEEVLYVYNPHYKINNNMASLGLTASHVRGKQFLYLHADILYHQKILEACITNISSTVLMVDKTKNYSESMKVVVKNNTFIESSKMIPIPRSYGEWIGINKFSAKVSMRLFEIIDETIAAGQVNVFDTHALTLLAKEGNKLPVLDVKGLPWIEIDTIEDYEMAKKEIYPRIINK